MHTCPAERRDTENANDGGVSRFQAGRQFLGARLESSIITHLRDFMMELGRGFAFVARQQHIRTDAEDYFIDLVFYNVVLKCYVLVDLKVGKITHQDVGQMDMYVRMYDELKRTEGDNPTIGIVLCSETDKDIARYSILKGNEQLFATKYKLYLPTEEQLRKGDRKAKKELYQIQHEEKKLTTSNPESHYPLTLAMLRGAFSFPVCERTKRRKM